MAIDDNTSYELTGAQVKDLANKIKGKAADNTFVGSTSAAPGSKGLVPEPQAGDGTKFLSGDGTWKDVPAGSSYTAGNGIDITNNVISTDTNVLATNKLVKNLAGGEQRAGKLIYMYLMNATNGEPIAQELGESVLFIMNNMVYIFAYAETGNLIKSANELGLAISNGAVVEYKSAASDTSDADTDNVVVTSAVGVEDENTGLYSVTINLRDLRNFDGKVKSIEVDVSADNTNGLWYKTSKTTFPSGETRFMIEGIFGSSMQQKVLEEIQSTMPEGEHMSPTQLWQMTFLFTDPRKGKLLKSASDIRSMFRRNNLPGDAILLTNKSSTFENGSIITSYSWSGDATTGFGIMRILCPDTLVSKEYIITATSQHGYTDERQYLWYIIEESTPDMIGISYGFPDASAIDVSTDAPWNTFQTAVDASGNLYMASGSTGASDWKQINNTATVNNGALTIQQNGTTLDTFTANSSDDKTVNIQTITAETVAPAEEVGAITTNMIADGAVTASKIDPTSFAVLVYVGEIAFVRKTYNNSPISLTDKIDFYAASNVSAAITSSTNLVMTLPADGSYIARVKASLWTNANSWDYMLLTIRKNENSFSKAMGPKNAGAWGFVNTEGYTTIANGDALSVYLNTNGNNFSDGNITRQDSKLIVEIYKVG